MYHNKKIKIYPYKIESMFALLCVCIKQNKKSRLGF
nr:MAG TPA: hypothetical protein [Caudoviricetes sp.]